MRQWQLDQIPVASRRTILALLDVTVQLLAKGHEPLYDLRAVIPLDVPHAVNDLWTEVSECT